MLTLSHLTVNGRAEPCGVAAPLELGWTLTSTCRNAVQESCRIRVTEAGASAPLLDTGWRKESRCAHVPLDLSLPELTRFTVSVQARAAGEESPIVSLDLVTALSSGSWRGQFVSAEPEEDRGESYCTLLRKSFSVTKPLKEAWLVSSAHGIYHAFLNGRPVSEDELLPGWTSYGKRLQIQTYEVTALLRSGENIIGAALGAGWYKGVMGYKHERNLYGTRTAFGGQLILRYADGTEEWICTDESWKGSRSPALFSEIYDGEVYDARLEQPGWCFPGFDDSKWTPAQGVERDIRTLVPQEGPPVRVMGRIPARELFVTPQGDRVLDFGQNLTGWCETVLRNTTAGEVLELQFFETLDAEGNVYTENLRAAKQTVRYICRGAEEEVCRPWFTFQGFRYARVVSFPGELTVKPFTACVVHSAMEETGSYRCSSNALNQLWHNILWGMKGNFVDVPTDCPQRDERLGWTGDIQAFAGTAAFLMDMDTFARKWLADLAADQNGDGSVPHVVPDILSGHMGEDWLLDGTAFQGGAAGWGDAAVILPWTLWQFYGDTEVLRRQMPSMLAWIRYLDHHSHGCLVETGDQFGDWLALDAASGSYKGATPDSFCASAWYCRSTRLVSRMLKAIRREEEAETLAAKAEQLREDFCRRYFRADGTLTVQTQTAHVLALAYDLVPEEFRDRTARRLRELLAEAGHLATGFLGTAPLPFALRNSGYPEEAWKLVMRREFPGWLYQVEKGATTVWEHWDGLKPDGSMWSPDMNSFNHYAYGAIGEWLYRTAGGMEPDEEAPGWEHFRIQPIPGGGLAWAETTLRSVRGPIRVRWEREEDRMVLEVEIPVGATADIVVPEGAELLETDGLDFRNGTARTGSGSYRICWSGKTTQ